jgi:hypothetical protein
MPVFVPGAFSGDGLGSRLPLPALERLLGCLPPRAAPIAVMT